MPALVSPSSPVMSTRQSSRIFAALSIAAKKRGPTGTSREAIASFSSALRVKRERKRVMMDWRTATPCLGIQEHTG